VHPGTHATYAPNRLEVIIDGSGRTVTYAELDDNSARLASALHAHGLRTGDVIAKKPQPHVTPRMTTGARSVISASWIPTAICFSPTAKRS